MDGLNISKAPLSLETSSQTSKRSFKVYPVAKKEIWNDQGFQVLIKKNVKTLKSIASQEFNLTPSNEGKADQIQRQKLKYLSKIIRPVKSLSNLNITIQAPNPTHINHLIPSLKHLNSLKIFSLGLKSKAFMTAKTCQNLTRCLRNFKLLANLDCSFYNGLKDNQKAIQSLRYISQLKHLNTFPIGFHGIREVKESFWRVFSRYFTRLSSLTTLEISHCEELTQTGLLGILESIGKLSKLRALNLQIRGSKVLDSNRLIQFFQNLSNLPHFQQLTLNLSNCKVLKDHNQDPLITGIALLNPTFLSKLSVEFAEYFSDSDLSEFFTILQRFSSLTYLSLNLRQLKTITPHAFSNLSQSITSMPSLIHLHVRINPRTDADSLLLAISLSLQNLPNLTSLKIEVWHNKTVKSSAVQKLFSCFSKLPQLTHLYLAFANCPNLRSVVLEDLAVALRNLINLKSLYLNYQSNAMTNKVFIRLVSSLEYLKSLWRLELHFNYYTNLEQYCFEILTKSLQQIPLLNTMVLGIRSDGQKDVIKNYKTLIREVGAIQNLGNITFALEEFREEDIDEEISLKILKNEKQHFEVYI